MFFPIMVALVGSRCYTYIHPTLIVQGLSEILKNLTIIFSTAFFCNLGVLQGKHALNPPASC